MRIGATGAPGRHVSVGRGNSRGGSSECSIFLALDHLRVRTLFRQSSNDFVSRMPRLQHDLAELKQMLITMGGLADDAVRRAISSIFSRDLSVAHTAKETDKEIDGLQLDLAEMASELLRSA